MTQNIPIHSKNYESSPHLKSKSVKIMSWSNSRLQSRTVECPLWSVCPPKIAFVSLDSFTVFIQSRSVHPGPLTPKFTWEIQSGYSCQARITPEWSCLCVWPVTSWIYNAHFIWSSEQTTQWQGTSGSSARKSYPSCNRWADVDRRRTTRPTRVTRNSFLFHCQWNAQDS